MTQYKCDMTKESVKVPSGCPGKEGVAKEAAGGGRGGKFSSQNLKNYANLSSSPPPGFSLDGGGETEEHGLVPLLGGHQQELPQEEQGDSWKHFSHKEPHLQKPVFVRPFHPMSILEVCLGSTLRRGGVN